MPLRTTVDAGAATNVHTLESLKKLPRTKLQALAKKFDYQANAKSADIIKYVLRASGSPAPAPAPLPPLWSPASLPAGPNGEMLDCITYTDLFDDARRNLGYCNITLLNHWECVYKPAFAKKGTGKEDNLGPNFPDQAIERFYSLGPSERAQVRRAHFNSLAPGALQTFAIMKGIAPTLGREDIIEELGQLSEELFYAAKAAIAVAAAVATTAAAKAASAVADDIMFDSSLAYFA